MSKEIIERIDVGLKGLIPAFMDNTYKEIDELTQALERNNLKEVYRLGHNIKGSALNYGFLLLAEIGRSIEKAAADNDLKRAEEFLVEMKKYVEELEIEFV